MSKQKRSNRRLKAAKEVAAKLDRKSTDREAMAAAICKALSQGQKLVQICRQKSMPSRQSIYRWLQSDAAFRCDCRVVQIMAASAADFAKKNRPRKVGSSQVYRDRGTIMAEICERMSDGQALAWICAEAHMPPRKHHISC